MSSTINGTGIFTHSYGRALSNMRSQFDDLNLQLATGLKSQTYGGLGLDRSLSLTLRGKLADFESYNANIQQVSLRTNMMMTSLTGLTEVASQTRGDLDPNNWLIVDDKRTIAQQSALSRLDTAIEALNVNIGGVYLFGGREVSARPVASASEILDGTVTQAGLRTVIAERNAADLGADGRGRLTQANAVGDLVTLGESASPNEFGFKLGAVSTSNSTAFTVASAAGLPPQVQVQLTGDPRPGDAVRFEMTLPDGTKEEIKLIASNNPPAPEFVAQADGKELPIGTLGTTALGDPLVSFAAGDTLTINGQTITVVASGAGPGQINGSASIDDLMTQIEGLSGIANAEFDPTTRQIRVQGTNGTDLAITGTAGAKLGLNGTVKAEELQKHTFQIAYDALGMVDHDATAANFASALDGAVKKEAKVSLTAASAVTASQNFFGNPPMRVDGAPPEAATGLVDGSATTIAWYRGENGTDSARSTQSARIDSTLNANYGARASEDGIREMMESLAVFGAMELDLADEKTGKLQYEALTSRVRPALASDTGMSTLEVLVTQIANVATSVESAKERHKQSEAVAETMLANVETVSKEEVAASLLALQTNLQASYQATAMLSQLSLVNFL